MCLLQLQVRMLQTDTQNKLKAAQKPPEVTVCRSDYVPLNSELKTISLDSLE